jgi:hypothetical protein
MDTYIDEHGNKYKVYEYNANLMLWRIEDGHGNFRQMSKYELLAYIDLLGLVKEGE